jgi:hypothetical protein
MRETGTMPKHSGLRILTASLVAIAAFTLAAAADEPKPASKAAPARPAGARPGTHAPGARPGMPGQRGAAFRGGPGFHPPAGHYDFRGRDFAHFSFEEQHAWAAGAWHQDWHDGRYGWWWFADDGWYLYDAPVYPMPLVVSGDYVPDPSIEAEAPPPDDPAYAQPGYAPPGYAPPGYGQPPPPPPQPQGLAPPQYWYYCDNPAGYYPYVQTCPSQFRPVPAVPPH